MDKLSNTAAFPSLEESYPLAMAALRKCSLGMPP